MEEEYVVRGRLGGDYGVITSEIDVGGCLRWNVARKAHLTCEGILGDSGNLEKLYFFHGDQRGKHTRFVPLSPLDYYGLVRIF